jgi:hypothetical protein
MDTNIIPLANNEVNRLLVEIYNKHKILIDDKVEFSTNYSIESIEYIEKPYFARGFTTVVFGDSGAAKSLSVIAKCCEWSRNKKRIVYFNTEDHETKMFNQRLKCNNADRDYFKAVNKSPAYNNDDAIKLMCGFKPDVIVYDMLKDMCPDKQIVMSSDDIRTVLSFLNAIAEVLNCCVIVLQHTNKAGGNKSVQRIQGSSDWFGKARSVLEVAYDEKNQVHNLFHQKANYTKKIKGFAFTIGGSDTDEPIVRWVDMTMVENDLHLVGNDQDGKTKFQEAEELIFNYLNETSNNGVNPVPSKNLEDFMKAESNITQITFRRARDKLKKDKIIKASRIGTVWCWELLIG